MRQAERKLSLIRKAAAEARVAQMTTEKTQAATPARLAASFGVTEPEALAILTSKINQRRL